MTEADIAYIQANFFSLEQVCRGRAEFPDDVRRLIEKNMLPKPSYILPDGTEMVPLAISRSPMPGVTTSLAGSSLPAVNRVRSMTSGTVTSPGRTACA